MLILDNIPQLPFAQHCRRSVQTARSSAIRRKVFAKRNNMLCVEIGARVALQWVQRQQTEE